MKTIVLASQKGGAGKTTLTAHLAVAAEKSGDGPCVLLDTDPQESLASWWNCRENESPAFATSSLADLPQKLAALEKAGFAYAFIDTPPAIATSIQAVVALADLVLIPTRPSPHDLRAVGRTVDLALAENRPFAFVLTQAKAGSRLTVQGATALSEYGVVAPSIVHDRVDYAASMIDGRTVMETDARGRSAAEASQLWTFVKEQLHGKKKKR